MNFVIWDYLCFIFIIGINLEKCVRFNFRKNLKNFRDCISKKSLLDNLIKKCKVVSIGDLEFKESYLIKIGLRNGKGGCVCILELIE